MGRSRTEHSRGLNRVALVTRQVVWISVAVAAAVAAQPSRPAVAAWQPVSGLSGSYIVDLAVDPTQPSVVLAAIDGGGIARSTNGGASWQLVTSGIGAMNTAWFVRFDPQAPGTAYCGGFFMGIWRSVDGGIAWSNVSPPRLVGASCLDLAFRNNGSLVLAAENAVETSSDHGLTWTRVDSTLSPSCVAVDASTDSIYVGEWLRTSNGLYKSGDGGATWSLVRSSPQFFRSIAVSKTSKVIAAFDDGAFCSCDYDTTHWTNLFDQHPGGPAAGRRGVWKVHYDNQPGLGYLYLASNDGLYRFKPGASSFERLGQSVLPSPFVRTVTSWPADPSRILAGTFFGPYSSNDSGATWSASATGLQSLHPILSRDGVLLNPAHPESMLVSTFGGGVLFSANGGLTFGDRNTGLATSHAQGLVLAPDGHTVLARLNGGQYLYRSTNWGQTWTASGTGLLSSVDALDFSPVNPQLVFAASRTFSRSQDGGLSWADCSAGIAPVGIQGLDVRFDPSGSFAMGVMSWDCVWKLSDPATCAWQFDNNGVPCLLTNCIEYDPFNPQRWFSGHSCGLYSRTGSTGSWTFAGGNMGPVSVRQVIFHPTRQGTMVAITEEPNLWRSDNGGTYWYRWNEDLPAGARIYDLKFHPTNSSIAYAATSAGLFRRDGDWVTGVAETSNETPRFLSSLRLANPVLRRGLIRYDLGRSGRVALQLFDARGRLRQVLDEGWRAAGSHPIRWDGRDRAGRAFPSGVYYLRLIGSGEVLARKVSLVK